VKNEKGSVSFEVRADRKEDSAGTDPECLLCPVRLKTTPPVPREGGKPIKGKRKRKGDHAGHAGTQKKKLSETTLSWDRRRSQLRNLFHALHS